ncbi:extracellular solute-binding protein [Cohnella hashimotonis]|uniref:Extracellular solute-binding protein n=1 Tax=Cohnella hashimotonis TaxID=2826895 RepID=A0ABT6TM71_9BACL|nr:extracellular solute-binding protein [Cohnella hashimotonis]MDI4647929.1 extracellular solute-binding protein [Cohnella hashimotonis]
MNPKNKTYVYAFHLLVAVMLVALLAGCGGEKKETSGGSASSSSAAPKTLKVAYFKGGYGDAWFLALKKEFEKVHQNVTVELEGDAGIMDKLDPRFESGSNLPDVAFLIHSDKWQIWAGKGYLADLSDIYDGDSLDGGKFKDTMNEEAQKFVSDKDKIYALPWSDGLLGMVYNAGMFEENGWEVPKTWKEFAQLADQMKAKGIAPIVYPGKIPGGYMDFLVKPMIVQAGGFDYLDELLKMESPEPLNNPAKKQALEQYEALFKNGWVLKGSEAVNHTEAQMLFLSGKAAMIPNGHWLENEMKSSIPSGFRMKMMPVPLVDNPKETNIAFSMVGGDITVIPTKAKEMELAKEFVRFAATKEMNKQFTALTGALRPFKYDMDGVQVSEFTQSVVDIMQSSKPFTFNSSSPMYMKFGGIFPSGEFNGNISTGTKTADQQFEDDYKFAKDKWDEYEKELGLK